MMNTQHKLNRIKAAGNDYLKTANEKFFFLAEHKNRLIAVKYKKEDAIRYMDSTKNILTTIGIPELIAG